VAAAIHSRFDFSGGPIPIVRTLRSQAVDDELFVHRRAVASFCFHHPEQSVSFLILCSAMIHPKTFRDGPMMLSGPDPLQDALELRAQIRGLKALLDLQRWQIEVLNERLYSAQPGGTAARRLLALKQSEERAKHRVELDRD
jgi:hypothetical protein